MIPGIAKEVWFSVYISLSLSSPRLDEGKQSRFEKCGGTVSQSFSGEALKEWKRKREENGERGNERREIATKTFKCGNLLLEGWKKIFTAPACCLTSKFF